MNTVTLLDIFNAHIDANAQIKSYEHPGSHMIKNEIMRNITNDLVAHLQDGTLDTSDLHIRINYNKPTSSAGNRKLRGIIYMASHPLIDCYLDGLKRQKPSCSGLNGWCYVFSDFYYKSFGKQLSMLANSLLLMLEPDRAEAEINAWIAENSKKFVPDRHGHVAFRVDEAGDITYCLPMWLKIADQHPELQFYAYTKQFEKINEIPYNIHDRHQNFRMLLSDSTVDDPNPISQVREDYGSFGINFKDPTKTPLKIKQLVDSHELVHKCPGASFGCFTCTKCSERETPGTKHIWAEEH